MVTTTWLGGSGDWNDAANWSNGVPGPDDDAVIPGLADSDTITGGGVAAELTVAANRGESLFLTLSGSYSFGQYVQLEGEVALAPSATLAFDTGTLSGEGVFSGLIAGLVVGSGASLGSGTLTLSDASLSLDGALSNPLLLADDVEVGGTGALTGMIGGSGRLEIGSSYGDTIELTNAANDFTGTIELDTGTLEVGATTALGNGTLQEWGDVEGVSLLIDPGVSLPPLSVGPGSCTIAAAAANQEVFAGPSNLTFINGSGASTVIGAVTPGIPYPNIDTIDPGFAALLVEGGSGSVTVFGGSESGTIYGGAAGNNVIVAGASLAGLTPAGTGSFFYAPPSGEYISAPRPVTIVGGGNGDLLVATGSLNNFVAAGSGNETLSAASATGNNALFGGSGNDLIAAGGGRDTVVAGTGASTIFGGAGGTDVFAGAGSALVVDGAGSDYVQAGAGNATIFAGSGSDLFGFTDLGTPRDILIEGFADGTDHITLNGYASGPAVTSANGSTSIALQDGTHILLAGVSSLTPGSFV